MPQTSYEAFSQSLEAKPFHNNVHMWVGGNMTDMQYSPQDPLFWLHHANVDRIWDLWQWNTNYTYPPTTSGADATMDPWTLRDVDVMVTTSLFYYYSSGPNIFIDLSRTSTTQETVHL